MWTRIVLLLLIAQSYGMPFEDESFLEIKALPKTYSSQEEALKAAEEEFANLGEEADTPDHMKSAAEQEVLNLVKQAIHDPKHMDLDGLKVHLGSDGIFADPVPETPKDQPEEKVAPEVVEVVDSRNEQLKKQLNEDDVPLARHSSSMFASRPSAPQFAPNMQLPTMDSGFSALFPKELMSRINAMSTSQFSSPQTPQMQLPPIQLADMVKQMSNMMSPQNNGQFRFPTMPFMPLQQNPTTNPTLQQTMAEMPKLLPQMMQQMPMLMQQMTQSMMKPMTELNQAMPQLMQQMPQMMHMLPQLPEVRSSIRKHKK